MDYTLADLLDAMSVRADMVAKAKADAAMWKRQPDKYDLHDDAPNQTHAR